MKRLVLTLLLSAALLASSVASAVMLERRDRLRRADYQDIVYLPPAWLARAASFGYRTLVADYYWIQGLQYCGNSLHRNVRYKDLSRYIELVIDLDPDFEYAYYFGGSTVPYNSGNWRWSNVDEALRILERGVERFPDSTRLWLLLGYTHAVLRDDPAAAAAAYRQAASGVSQELGWINSLITRLEASSGRLDRARAYAEEVLARTEDPHLAEAMERRLVEFEVEEILQTLDRAKTTYREQQGHIAHSLDDLVSAGLLDAVPPCPLGGEFALGTDGEPYSTILEGGRLRAFNPPARQSAQEQRRAEQAREAAEAEDAKRGIDDASIMNRDANDDPNQEER